MKNCLLVIIVILIVIACTAHKVTLTIAQDLCCVVILSISMLHTHFVPKQLTRKQHGIVIMQHSYSTVLALLIAACYHTNAFQTDMLRVIHAGPAP